MSSSNFVSLSSRIKRLEKKVLRENNEDLLSRYIFGKYSLNSRGLIDVNGSVDFENSNISSILEIGRFGKVTGSFVCSANPNLESLEGSPSWVGGQFRAEDCSLRSLKFAPRYVGEGLILTGNKLKSLDYCPIHIGGAVYIDYNELVSLIGLPKTIGGKLNCSSNRLKNLKGCPRRIKDHFIFDDNPFVSLEGCPSVVEGTFSCCGSNVDFTEEDVEAICKTDDILIN